MKWISAKMAVLIYLLRAGRVSEITAHSVENMVMISQDDVKVIVYPDKHFVPKTHRFFT